MDIQIALYDFAASAGALEGYAYPKVKIDPAYLPKWTDHLVAAYQELSPEVRDKIQGALDGTLGRAVRALIPVLGEDDETVKKLKSMISFRRDESLELTGRVVSGVQEASFFTGLDWVQEQCMEKLGFRPYPGTLNLSMEILVEGQPTVKDLRKQEGPKLIPPDPNFCAATVLPVYLGGVKGAIVVPAEDVNVHGKQILEVLAPLKLRDCLGVKDGDLVTLVLDRFV
ncbi:conserved hypothetical protein [delta proteobacterium NaphS2]|nr:conserved hypothetical protein [delta proteobacterium NaphS2]